MRVKWSFAEIPDDMEERDPHEDVFFNKGNKAEALVREFIQNALDAKADGEDKVKIKMNLEVMPSEKPKEYLYGLKSHLKRSIGLPESYDYEDQRVLVLEDFGTTGLDGNIHRSEVKEDSEKSNFYDFWWSEGKSEKGGGNIGSWGLGKTTYHMASEINTFWGLTIRRNDRRELLMGKSLLKSHEYSGRLYHYSGKYKVGDNEPVEDSDFLKKFKEDLPIRREDEPGFSVIIPFSDKQITFEQLVKYSIKHYFFAILNDGLEIEIAGRDEGPVVIDSNTILDHIESTMWADTDWRNRNIKELIEFTQEGIKTIRDGSSQVLDPENEIEGYEDFQGKEELESRFNNGEFLSLKIPVEMEEKGGDTISSHFYLFLRKFPERHDMDPDEFYIRSGIHIAEEYSGKLGSRPVRGMLVVEDEKISRFLSGAEEPAHLEWNASLEDYKENYDNAWNLLRLIRNSLHKVVQSLDKTKEKESEEILQDIFSIKLPEEDQNDGKKEGSDKEGGGENEPEDPGEIRGGKKKVNVSDLEDGFKVEYIGDKEDLPYSRKIKTAYDTYSGDPFNNYEKFDFDLSDPRMIIECNGVEMIKNDKNEIEVKFLEKESNVCVKGFDTNRDLVVRVVSQ